MPNSNDITPEFSDKLIKRLASGSIWNFIATLFNQGSVIVVNVVVARIVGKHAFGEYSIIVNTLITIATLIQLSMGYTVTKFVAEFRSSDREKTSRILGLCLVMSISMACFGTFLLVICASPLSAFVMKAPHLMIPLMIGGGYIFFSAVNGYQTGTFAAIEAYKSLSKAGVISGIVTIISVAAGSFWFGLNGALIGLSVSSLLKFIFHNIWLRRELYNKGLFISFNHIWREKGIILKFALPAAISGYITMPVFWLGNTMLIRQPNGFEQMAFYNAAFTIRLAVIFIPIVINNVSMSILNNLKGANDLHEYWRTFRITFLATILIISIILFIILLFGPIFLSIFGKEFIDGFFILKILLLATLIEGMSVSVYQIIQSHGLLWQSFWFIVIPYCTVFLVLVIYLVPVYGAVGLAWAYTMGWLLNLTATCLISYRISKKSSIIVEKKVCVS